MSKRRFLPPRRTHWLLAAAILGMSAWFFPYFPPLGSPNELSRLYLTRAIVDDGSFSIDGPVARYGRITDLASYEGRLHSDKAPGIGMAGVPLYVAAKALAGWDAEALPNSGLLRLMRFFLSGIPTAGCVLLLFYLLGRLEIDRDKRLFLTAAYGVATIAFTYGVLLFGHQTASLCLLGAFAVAERHGRKPGGLAPVVAGFLLGTALLMEYTTILLVVPLAIYAIITAPRRLRDSLAGLGGCLLPLGLLALYHTLCFSHPLSTGYAHLAHRSFAEVHDSGLMGMVSPDLKRLGIILASPTKGLLFFSPWLLLALPALVAGAVRPLSVKWRVAWLAIGAATILYLLFSASLQLSAWGWSLGPRHLCPCLPFLVLSIGVLLRRGPFWASWTTRALLVLVPFSAVAIALPTASFGGFPPDFSNPLADFSMRLAGSGCLSPGVGTWLGFSPGWAALPFWICLVSLLGWMVTRLPGSRLEKTLCVLLSLSLLAVVLFSRGPENPREERTLRWVQQDIMKCDPS